jgi:hypothetical protein
VREEEAGRALSYRVRSQLFRHLLTTLHGFHPPYGLETNRRDNFFHPKIAHLHTIFIKTKTLHLVVPPLDPQRASSVYLDREPAQRQRWRSAMEERAV